MEEINEEIRTLGIIEHIKDLFNNEQEKKSIFRLCSQNTITRTIRKHEKNIK